MKFIEKVKKFFLDYAEYRQQIAKNRISNWY